MPLPKAALVRGDCGAATSRKVGALDDLVARFGDKVVPLVQDVMNRAACFETVVLATAPWGGWVSW